MLHSRAAARRHDEPLQFTSVHHASGHNQARDVCPGQRPEGAPMTALMSSCERISMQAPR